MQWTKTQLSVVSIVAVTSFMGTFLISSINIALPSIGKEFGLNSVALSWIVTAFLLANAMFLLPVGRWGDLTGIRRMYRVGLIVFALSSLLCGLSGSGFWLILFRFIQGIGAAFTNTTGQAILVSAFLPKHRGRVLGISVSAVYLGLAFGPFVGGFMTQYIGWRSIFYLASVLGVISSVIAFVFLDKDEPIVVERKKIDLRGIFFYMLGLVGLVYGSSRIPGALGWLLMGIAVVLLIIFWLMESKSTLPVIDTKLFTNNHLFAYSNLAALINYSATSAIVFFLSLYLQKIQGLSPREAGTILIAQPVMMAVFSPLVGRLSNRIQPRYLSTLGMTMCGMGLIAFAFFTAVTSHWVIITVLLWVGLGFAFFSSPNMNTIMSSVNKSQYGLASGSAASMRVIGQIISMTIVTLFFAGKFGSRAIEAVPDSVFLNAMKWGFITFSVLSIVGIYFSYNRGQMNHETATEEKDP